MVKKGRMTEKNSNSTAPYMGSSDIALQNEASSSHMFYNIRTWQFRGDSIIEYDRALSPCNINRDKATEIIEKQKDTYRGYLSDQGRRRIKKILDIWMQGIVHHNNEVKRNQTGDYHKMIMLTTTLSASQRHTDQDIKKYILKPFLRLLREKYGCKNYLWKAEKQQNNNIHFHIALDTYVDKDLIRKLWNNCQNKLNYIDRYFEKTNKTDAPSIRIEAAHSQKGLSVYLQKYISKVEYELPVGGAIWKCSANLRTLKYYETEVSNDEIELLNKKIEQRQVSFIFRDSCTIIKMYPYLKVSVMSELARKYYINYLKALDYVLYGNGEDREFVTYYNRVNILSGLAGDCEIYYQNQRDGSETRKERKRENTQLTLDLHCVDTRRFI